MGAIQHLRGDHHGNLHGDGALAIETLGIHVRNCDAQKAKSNNDVFKNALVSGYKPFRAVALPTSGPDQLGQPGTSEEPSPVPNEASHGPRTNTSRAFEGIIDPAVGELYRLRYGDAYWVVLMLPTGSFETVGMVGGIADTELVADHIPKCYLSNKGEKKIYGWADNYKDGGPFICRRTFPVMYLNGLDIPRHGVFEIPDGERFSWVPAKDLRPFNFVDSECQSAHGFRAAEDFHRRMNAIHENMARAEGCGNTGLLLK